MKAKHGLKNKAILFNFDVTVGSWKGAEVCELIAIFMLSLIGTNMTLKISDYTEMTDWQFLKTKVTHSLEKLKRLLKKCLRTKV